MPEVLTSPVSVVCRMIRGMPEVELQNLCEKGQLELMETRYLEAADTLGKAERLAWDARDFDTLSRLYLPLQEAHRQIRQRCGEGAVRLHLIPTKAGQSIDPHKVLAETRCGQLLAAGWENIEPALEIRRLAKSQHLYVETFLASVQPGMDGKPEVKIVPMPRWAGPCPVLQLDQIPADSPAGNAETFANVMALWEQLHTPFLSAAGQQQDPILRMQAYRSTLCVDPACELAHQYLADIARKLART